jgi:hypothetical protein
VHTATLQPSRRPANFTSDVHRYPEEVGIIFRYFRLWCFFWARRTIFRLCMRFYGNQLVSRRRRAMGNKCVQPRISQSEPPVPSRVASPVSQPQSEAEEMIRSICKRVSALDRATGRRRRGRRNFVYRSIRHSAPDGPSGMAFDDAYSATRKFGIKGYRKLPRSLLPSSDSNQLVALKVIAC